MKKILIVDDEKDIVELLQTGLKRSGFEIAVAFDGREALDKINEFKPDLVILDVAMPHKNGLEVLQWIKTNYPSMLTIMATAKKEVQDIKEGYALKADYYVTKPYALDEILKGIRVLLSLSSE
ncbi:MAG: response regulator [Candidatus Omnitrophica bacterium]|nr:response regulator [Candidatus Omnitrophota bacterium]